MTDHFRRIYDMGFMPLPIVPPGAPVSERSTMFKRIGTPQDSRGKIPGVRGRDGKWYGIDLTTCVADEHDLVRWAAMGAGVGIRTGLQPDGTSLVAIDADTMNTEHARTIKDAIDARLGRLPIRVGQHPKALYLCRVRGALPYQRIEFGTERVELLTDGRQFVAEGIHPKTGKPYSWPRELVAYEALPVCKPEDIAALLEALRSALPEASKVIVEGAGNEVNQASLAAPVDAVRKAVNAIPNTSAQFPSRESYRDMGYAIKAALPDDEPAAFEIFSDWCARWADGVNDPDVVASDWKRMKPPFRRGASWLLELAAEHGAVPWFEPIADSTESLFPIESEIDTAGDVFPLLSLDEIVSRPPPAMLIARHIPAVSLGFLYSVPGAGKSFIAQDIGLHIASELAEWHGDDIKADSDAMVLYIAAEGSYGLRNRVRAWAKQHNRPTLPERFLVIEQTIDFMRIEDIDKLMRTVRAAARGRPCLIVVDTVSRAMPGADENLQKEMTLFVRACDRLRDAFKCAVLGVHHAGKNGDMRGSTVLLGAGDFVFRLERQAGRTIGHLHCEKQKDAADGWSEPYAFNLVPLEDGETSLVVTRAALGVGPAAELTPALAGEVLAAMREAWVAGEPWAKTYHAKDRWAVKQMAKRFGFEPAAAEELLSVWEGSGMIADEVVSPKSKLRGFRVVAEAAPGQVGASVFD